MSNPCQIILAQEVDAGFIELLSTTKTKRHVPLPAVAGVGSSSSGPAAAGVASRSSGPAVAGVGSGSAGPASAGVGARRCGSGWRWWRLWRLVGTFRRRLFDSTSMMSSCCLKQSLRTSSSFNGEARALITGCDAVTRARATLRHAGRVIATAPLPLPLLFPPPFAAAFSAGERVPGGP